MGDVFLWGGGGLLHRAELDALLASPRDERVAAGIRRLRVRSSEA